MIRVTGRPVEAAPDRTKSSVLDLGPRRKMEAGDEFTVTGEGRFRFKAYVRVDGGAEWVDCWGPIGNRAAWHSFRLDQVGTIHRTVKGRPS